MSDTKLTLTYDLTKVHKTLLGYTPRGADAAALTDIYLRKRSIVDGKWPATLEVTITLGAHDERIARDAALAKLDV